MQGQGGHRPEGSRDREGIGLRGAGSGKDTEERRITWKEGRQEGRQEGRSEGTKKG